MTALNSLRETALHSACRSGSVECAQLLVIKYGLDVNAPNAYHETPMLLMAKHNSEKLQILMENSKWKRTPRSLSLGDIEMHKDSEGGDHLHKPRRQSEIRIQYNQGHLSHLRHSKSNFLSKHLLRKFDDESKRLYTLNYAHRYSYCEEVRIAMGHF